MKFKSLIVAAALLVASAAAGAANAASYVFVGAWQVDQGAHWSTQPLAYTGQEAAALLFGGAVGDYVTSTKGSDVGQIDFKAWYSIIGYGTGALAQDYVSKYDGQYYGPVIGYPSADPSASASAYVNDNAQGGQYTNYAFRLVSSAVPEPATWAMMIGGFGLAGATLRRRRAAQAFA